MLGESTPRLWLEKVDFIEKWNGMALINSHPDYLRHPANLKIYADFLSNMKHRSGYWHALPKAAARWWRERSKEQGLANQCPALATITDGAIMITPSISIVSID